MLPPPHVHTHRPDIRDRLIASYPDVRIYQANARGVVHGFVYVYPVLPPFHGCGKGLETVPIGITFTDFSLVNGVTFDAIYVTGTFSGAIEPD